MVVLADFPGDCGTRLCWDSWVILPTCSRGQVLHHARQVVTVGVAVAEEQDVLVISGQPLLTLLREGQPRGLDLTGGTITSGRISFV